MTSSNKNPAAQAAIRMRMHKDIAQGRVETDIARDKRKTVKESNGSCLTCKYIDSQRGVFLHCSKKDKNVRQYNYCEYWKVEESK